MAKSPDAFRTISEVADWLGIQAHVLRFWESKFTQVKPIKRAGGRRYYRPTDMQLLGGIKKLLHDDGLTIKGVQKILREEGMNHVAAMSAPLDELTQSQVDDAQTSGEATGSAPAEPEKGVVLSFEAPVEKPVKDDPEPLEEEVKEEAEASAAQAPEQVDPAPEEPEVAEEQSTATPEISAAPEATPEDLEPVPQPDQPATAMPEAEPETTVEDPASEPPALPTEPRQEETSSEPEPVSVTAASETEPEPAVEHASDAIAENGEDAETTADSTPASASLPAFLRRPLVETDESAAETNNTPASAEPEPVQAESEPATAAPEPPAPPPRPKPRVLPAADITPEADFPAAPAVLAAAYRLKAVDSAKAEQIAPLLAKLTVLRDSMAARRRSGNTPPAPNP